MLSIATKTLSELTLGMAKFLPQSRVLPKRYKFLTLALTTILMTTGLASRASANIFSGAQKAMECVVKDATSGNGSTNTLINNLPKIIFTAITVVIFAYLLISAIQIFQTVRAGEEATQMVIPFMTAIIGIVVIMIFQNVLFGAGGSC